MSNDNLKLWDSVSKTDKKAKKEVKVGRTYTAIDPYWQIKEATKLWGSYGKTWGFKNIELTYELSILGLVSFKGLFYYPEGEFPIINACSVYTDNAKTKLDSDFAKKVETDTLTKALSKLGFSSDVFLSKFTDIEEINANDDIVEMVTKINKCDTTAQVIQLYNKNKDFIDKNTVEIENKPVKLKSIWDEKRNKLKEGIYD